MRSMWVFATMVVGLAVTVAAAGDTQQAVATGLFTQAQVDRGREAYMTFCAACHGSGLDGKSIAPALAGAGTLAVWARSNRTLDDMLYILRTTMPPGQAAAMSDAERLDILAFILERNGYATGPSPLAGDASRLAAIRIQPQPPRPIERPNPPAFVPGTRGSSGKMTGPTHDELLNAQRSGDWLFHTHDYTGRRYAELDQITPANAAGLQPVCAYQFGVPTNNQTGPIVYRGVMYLTAANTTVAIDATTCRPVWRHDWAPLDDVASHVNRGVAIKDGRLLRGTTDGYLIALDAGTGDLLWGRHIASDSRGEFLSMAPMAYDDLVFIGPGGSESGANGWVRAFRLEDGNEVWRFDVIPKPGEPGSETWVSPPGVPVGGGTIWTPFTLDAEAGVLYVATANPAPDFPAELRGGANLYTNTLLALDARTGRLLWHEQMVPADDHDWDLTQANPLFTAKVGGVERKLIGTVGKDGVLRVVDRESHERLYETPITTIENIEAEVTPAGTHACPGVLGGVEWNGPAFNPVTNLIYTPAVDWCGTFYTIEKVRFVPGALYLGGTYVADEAKQGWVTAVDASDGSVRWRYRSPRPMVAAVATTSGGVLFTAELTGDFLVLDARTGSELYRFNMGGPAGGGVVTYAVDGRQYVAVMSGQPSPFWIDEHPGAPTTFVFALPRR